VHILLLNIDAYALNIDSTAVGKQYIRSIIFYHKQGKIIYKKGCKRDTGIFKVGSKERGEQAGREENDALEKEEI